MSNDETLRLSLDFVLGCAGSSILLSGCYMRFLSQSAFFLFSFSPASPSPVVNSFTCFQTHFNTSISTRHTYTLIHYANFI